MPDRVKSSLKPTKQAYIFSLWLWTYLSIKVRGAKTWSAVRLFGKKPIWDLWGWSVFKDMTCSRNRWFKVEVVKTPTNSNLQCNLCRSPTCQIESKALWNPQSKHTSFPCDYERTYLSRFGVQRRGLLCRYLAKSQFEIFEGEVYLKTWHVRGIVGLR